MSGPEPVAGTAGDREHCGRDQQEPQIDEGVQDDGQQQRTRLEVHHGHSTTEQPGTDDAEGKDNFRERAGNRAQRFGRLRRGLDIHDARHVQCRGGAQDDEESDQI